MHRRLWLATTAILLTSAGTLRAQLWDAPAFQPPGADNSLGVYLFDPQGLDAGIVGIWRQGDPGFDLGARVGILHFDDPVVLVGADASGALIQEGPELPFDADWTFGVGAAFDGDATLFRIPLGVTVGRGLGGDLLGIVPYIHPRIALDIRSFDGATETEFNATTDLGVDLHLGPDWMLRFGISIGDGDALGAGLAWRRGRGVAAGSH